MAIESVATSSLKAVDYKEGYYRLSSDLSGLSLDLLKIKAIARMLSEHHDFNEAGFPEDIYGGVIAILDIASRAYDQGGAESGGKQ